MPKKSENLIGEKFGMLTVISQSNSNKQKRRMWICRCDCGKLKEKAVTTHDLKSGAVRSCGCLYYKSNKLNSKKHGKTRSRLFVIWSGIKSRCTYEKNIEYKNYGGRGITVCDEWAKDFMTFYNWSMANGYQDNLTIDRIDNDKGYYPDNCRWVTMREQQNNRKNNRKIMYENKEYTVSKLSEKLNIPYATLLWRINNGWKLEELSLTPSLNNRIKRSINNE